MRIAIDSCSIILLSKATVLEVFAKKYNLFITEIVYDEILRGKDKKFIDALLIEKLVSEKKIKTIKARSDIVKKIIEDFNLGYGEAETLALVLEKRCDVIVTDNKQGRKTAIIYDLGLVGSIDIIISLYKLKIISKDKALQALGELRKFGWFQDYLIDNAFEEVKNA